MAATATSKNSDALTGHVTTRRYAQLLERAHQVVESMTMGQFELGDIALEIEPIQTKGSHGEHVYQVLEAFADELGIPLNTLLEYRMVAAAWPRRHRDAGTCWSVHRELRSVNGRFDIIKNPTPHPADGSARWTTNNAARIAGHRPNWQSTLSEKVDRIHELAHDDDIASQVTRDLLMRPKVASQVAADPTVRHMIDRARLERDVRSVQGAQAPIPARIAQRREVIELLASCMSYVAATQRVLPTVLAHGITDEEKAAVNKALTRVRAATDWCETAVASGDSTLEGQLAKILNPGGEAP